MFRKLSGYQGFTLVEITITTGIILLIAAIAIFSFSKIRINVNEAAAVENVQSIAAALEIYQMAHTGCPATINELATVNPPYISDAFADGRHQGYVYYVTQRSLITPRGIVASCGVIAYPEVSGTTGVNYVGYYNKETRKFNSFNEVNYFVTGVQGGPGLPPG